MALCRGRGFAEFFHRSFQIGQGFGNGNQLAALSSLQWIYSPMRPRQDRGGYATSKQTISRFIGRLTSNGMPTTAGAFSSLY